MSTNNKGTFQPDADVHISFEDQQKINKFARLNAKRDDLNEEIKSKESDLENLQDACEMCELMVLEDEDIKIPFSVGEVFIYQDVAKTHECLEKNSQELKDEIAKLKSESEKVLDLMVDLKSHLYGKFGSHINLEPDE